MKSFSILIISALFFSCNANKDSRQNDCKDAVIDEKIESLSQFNKDFYEENYTGTVVSHFENNENQIKWIAYYENGEIVKYESFYENGDPKLVKPIKCNSSHGNSIYYMDYGKIGYELEYKLGKKDGVGKSYFENGKIQKLVQYKNDKKHGKQYEFNEYGDTLLIEIYENGKKIK